jgi:hemoglobin-like flavoprotein
MTAREKQVVRESFDSLRGVAGPLSLLFYGRLFELEPGLRPMFRGDIAQQGRKLMEMLSAVVDHLDRLETLTPTLHALGRRHVSYGVVAEHYGVVERALLWSLGHALEANFDEEARAAWSTAIRFVSAGMQAGAVSYPNTPAEAAPTRALSPPQP